MLFLGWLIMILVGVLLIALITFMIAEIVSDGLVWPLMFAIVAVGLFLGAILVGVVLDHCGYIIEFPEWARGK